MSTLPYDIDEHLARKLERKRKVMMGRYTEESQKEELKDYGDVLKREKRTYQKWYDFFSDRLYEDKKENRKLCRIEFEICSEKAPLGREKELRKMTLENFLYIVSSRNLVYQVKLKERGRDVTQIIEIKI